MPAARISLRIREKKRRATDVGFEPLRVKSGVWTVFTAAICHYIDRDRSFGSYVNKKARIQRAIVSAGFIVQCRVTYDRSIALCGRMRKKSCFHFFPLGRAIKFVHIDAFSSILYKNRKFVLFANLYRALAK